MGPQVNTAYVSDERYECAEVFFDSRVAESSERGVAKMRGRIPRFAILLAAALLLAAGQVSAQTISGIIAGRATDPQNKALSSVAITAHNPGTGRDFPASTDEQGYYRILEVPPGLYQVTAILGGFETVKHTDVRVDVNRTTVEDFPMKIQTKEESVTVESTAPMAVMDSPTLSSAFPDKQITELPVLTRDVNNLALLAPGVLSVRTFSFASTLVPFSVNGSRGRDNNFIIDSVDNNEPLFGGAASQFTNAEIFQEYSILTGQLKAEFGRNSGATVNAITKSGSNNWHGTLFAYGQDDAFDALNRVEKQALLTSPEPFYDTTLGLTLGGPVRKDKAFFFLSYQWDRLSDNLTDVFPVLSNYPASPADLAILRSLPTTPTLQAYLATPSVEQIPTLAGTPCFFGAPPPPTAPSPQLYSAKNPCLLTSTSVPVSGALAGPVQSANFNVWNDPNANTFNLRDHQLSGRYDQRLNNSNDFYTRYLFDDLAAPSAPLESAGIGAFSDIGLLPDWKTYLHQRTQSFLLDHRYYRVSSLNEFRISYSRVSQGQSANLPAPMLNDASAIIADTYATPLTMGGLGGQGGLATGGTTGTVATGLFPSVGSDITLGQDTGPSNITSNTYQIQDNFSYTYGRHSMKFGVNFVKIDTNVDSSPDDPGFYLFAGGYSGNGFQDFATNPSCCINEVGTPVSSLASVVSQRFMDVRTNAEGMIIGQGPNEVKIKEFDQFYFAQDDWRVKENLTLNLGIRYENFGQPINSIHDLNPAAPVVNTDNKDFAPRLGFAWSPAKGWAVRGGYGISYDPPILNIPLLIWQSGPVSPLIATDNFGLDQIQPTGAYPSQPLTLADLQTSVQTAFSGGASVPAGFVQGCSQYLDLLDLENGTPLTAGRVFVPGALTPAGTPAPDTIPITNCSDQSTVAKNLKNPYLQIWSLGVQKELGSNYLFEVNYVGSKGSRLFQRIELNPYQGWNSTCIANLAPTLIADGIGNLAVPGQCRFSRIDDTHGDITEVTNGGSSSYNALQATLTKRLSRNRHFGDFTFTMAYTWSHLIDNTSEIFGPEFRTLRPGDIQPPTAASSSNGIPVGLLFDPLANAPAEAITPLAQSFDSTTSAERGSSSFDRRHRFVTSFLWEPFPTRNAFLRGWQLNGIYTYQSGQPFTPLNASPYSSCSDTNGDGSVSNDRPNIGNPHAPKDTVALLADPLCLNPALGYNVFEGAKEVAAGVTPTAAATMARFVQRPLFASATLVKLTPGAPLPAGYAGTAGRNSLVGPDINNLDFSIYRTLKLGERFSLQLRAEAYDLFNRANPGYFNGSPYISNASGAPAFAYAATRTGAAITGGIPENAIDAVDTSTGNHTFLSQSNMNTSSRRLQLGLRLIF